MQRENEAARPGHRRVTHVITGLGRGGAETALLRLTRGLRTEGWTSSVISLTGGGPVAPLLAATGCEVSTLDFRRHARWWTGTRELARTLRRLAPDVIHTWMYHANLVGGAVAHTVGRWPVLWAIRAGDLREAKWTTRAVGRACTAVSTLLPDAIVFCSRDAAEHHASLGYPRDRMLVIPNGIEITTVEAERTEIRRELDLPATSPIVGLVANFTPEKDHPTFIAAATMLASERPDVVFVLCGRSIDERNGWLREALEARGLRQRVRLLGERADVSRILAGLDLLTLTSVSEGFPNALLEGMAAGLPCVATDIGDCRFVLGPDGLVVPPRNPPALARAWAGVLAMRPDARAAIGQRLKARVAECFSLRETARAYAGLYADLVVAGRGASASTNRPIHGHARGESRLEEVDRAS